MSAVRGLLVEPVSALQTASTHILCLHSLAAASLSLSLSPRDVYLCAGTNMGTVYVWKLSAAQLAGQSDLGPHCLHSHIQSSEDPIIHLSLSRSRSSSAERLALLASDNQGAVHLHLAPPRPASAPFFLAASQSFSSAVVGCSFRRSGHPAGTLTRRNVFSWNFNLFYVLELLFVMDGWMDASCCCS